MGDSPHLAEPRWKLGKRTHVISMHYALRARRACFYMSLFQEQTGFYPG